MKFTIGADPEVFTTKNGLPYSAHELIRGSKHEPFKVKLGAIQVDGTALEFNIEPAGSADEFVHNINTVYEQMKAEALAKDPNIEFAVGVPHVTYDKQYFDTIPEGAKELGCEPDFNAYTKKMNPVPVPTEGFRTTAGHIHIGWGYVEDPYEAQHFEMALEATKALDATLGWPADEIDPNNRKRQQLYGNFGAFRPKPYGFEYRVLSNFWLKNDALKRWVFERTLWTMNHLASGQSPWNDVTYGRQISNARLEKMGAPVRPALV